MNRRGCSGNRSEYSVGRKSTEYGSLTPSEGVEKWEGVGKWCESATPLEGVRKGWRGGRWWQYAVSPGTFLTAFPGKAWIRCLYDGSAYNETEKVTGKCALVGTFQSTGIRNTFGRWDENARKLRTLGRWESHDGRRNTDTGSSRSCDDSAHLRKVRRK